MADTAQAEDRSMEDIRIGNPVLVIDNVLKRFGEHTVLDHISFDVKKHETVALLAPRVPASRPS